MNDKGALNERFPGAENEISSLSEDQRTVYQGVCMCVSAKPEQRIDLVVYYASLHSIFT